MSEPTPVNVQCGRCPMLRRAGVVKCAFCGGRGYVVWYVHLPEPKPKFPE